MNGKYMALALATDMCFCNICMRIDDCNECEFQDKQSVLFIGLHCELGILNKIVERYISKDLFDKVHNICSSSICSKCEFNDANKVKAYNCMLSSIFNNLCTKRHLHE